MDLYVYQWSQQWKTFNVYAHCIDTLGDKITVCITGYKNYFCVPLCNGLQESDITDAVSSDGIVGRQSSGFLYKTDATHTCIVTCANPWKYKEAVSKCVAKGYKICEDAADVWLKIASEQNLPTVGWIHVTSQNLHYTDVRPSDRSDVVCPRIMAFDLEVGSDHINKMPDNNPNECIFQISCCMGQDDYLLTLNGDLSGISNNIRVEIYQNEKDLLQGFLDIVARLDPVIMTGYNILGFDIDYLYKRCAHNLMVKDLANLGTPQQPAHLKTRSWSSSAYSNQEYKFMTWENIVLLDLLPLVKRDYKLDNYKLDTVAEYLIQASKDDVSPADIHKAYHSKKGLGVVGKYCVKDSRLCLDLENKMHSWITLVEMAKVCHVQPFDLYTRGQQLKIYSQVYWFCKAKNVTVNSPNSNGLDASDDESYVGATVLDVEANKSEYAVSLDFASLYPTIMIAYNICYSTQAPNDAPSDQVHEIVLEDHLGCEHDPKVQQKHVVAAEIADTVRYFKGNKNVTQAEKMQLKELRTKRQDLVTKIGARKVCTKPTTMRFWKKSTKLGIIPQILQELLSERAAVKKEIKNCTGTDAIILDKKQLALKVSANSAYGTMGARTGRLPFKDGAACITKIGRDSILLAKNLVEKQGGKVIYGDTDSNYVIFPNLPHDLDTVWKKATDLAKYITKYFPDPMRLEFENKVYKELVVLGKKKYAAKTLDRDGNESIYKRGVCIARRDNSKFLRDVYESMLNMYFDGQTLDHITTTIQDKVSQLYNGELDMDLVITKSVKAFAYDDGKCGDYKVKPLPTNPQERAIALGYGTEKDWAVSQLPGHVALAAKMTARGNPVQPGSRISFVVTKGSDKLKEQLVDLDRFNRLKKWMMPDYTYYAESIVNPCDQFLFAAFNKKYVVETIVQNSTQRVTKPKTLLTGTVVAKINRTINRCITKCTWPIAPEWQPWLDERVQSEWFDQLATNVEQERQQFNIFPKTCNMLAWSIIPPEKVKVVIIGQDPYHSMWNGQPQATGMAFSTRPGCPLQPSVKNILTELKSDTGILKTDGDLTGWAKQGVLLLNTCLTVRENQPGSHTTIRNIGWERFTRSILCKISCNDTLIFLCWGRKACDFVKDNVLPHHKVLKAAHPSPYSVSGFYGCKHFSKCNQILQSRGHLPIDWSE